MDSFNRNSENDEISDDFKSVSQLFDDALDLFNNLTNGNVQVEDQFEKQLLSNISSLEKITKCVSQLRLFSDNEDWEELPTTTLKYFLLPAMLGFLTLECRKQDRYKLLQISEVYFKDFIKRCHNYGISKFKINESVNEMDVNESGESSSEARSMIAASVNRQSKIMRFKERKELEEVLQVQQSVTKDPNADESDLRSYYCTMIKHFCCKVMDELDNIAREKPILENIEKMKTKKPVQVKETDRPAPQPLKTLIITKDEIQKKIYGFGYPSLPIFSIEDFYEERQKQGLFPAPGSKAPNDQSAMDPDKANERDEDDAAEKEKLLEEDDPEALQKARDWDDWRDDHRRGWGNRHNMG